MKNGCKECIVYQIMHNEASADFCENCGKNTMEWHQNQEGFLYLECSNCHEKIAVDLNTPCELDSMFRNNPQIRIEPQQTLPDQSLVVALGRLFVLNALNMRKALIEGAVLEVKFDKFADVLALLQDSGIGYSLENCVDYRELYTYYKECKSPYSRMRHFTKN